MKKQNHQNEFITLRAQGMTFEAISQKLGVSKQSLIAWSKDLSAEIANLKAIELEALAEKYFMLKQQRITMFGEELQRVKGELEQRDLSEVPTDKLYTLLITLQDKLFAELSPLLLRKVAEGYEWRDESYKHTIEWEA